MTAPIRPRLGTDGPCRPAIAARSGPSARLARAWVLGLGLVLFGVRLAGPPDLTDNDQERPSAYVLDVVQNGNWCVQRDAYGEIASKPPLTWLAGLSTLAPAGRLAG